MTKKIILISIALFILNFCLQSWSQEIKPFELKIEPTHQTTKIGETVHFKLLKVLPGKNKFLGGRKEVVREIEFRGEKAGEFPVSGYYEGKTAVARVTVKKGKDKGADSKITVKKSENFKVIINPPHQTIPQGQTAVFKILKITEQSGWRKKLNMPKEEVVGTLSHYGQSAGEFSVQGTYAGTTVEGTVNVTEKANRERYSLYMVPEYQTIKLGESAVFKVVKTKKPKSKADFIIRNKQEVVNTVTFHGKNAGEFTVYGTYGNSVVEGKVNVEGAMIEPAGSKGDEKVIEGGKEEAGIIESSGFGEKTGDFENAEIIGEVFETKTPAIEPSGFGEMDKGWRNEFITTVETGSVKEENYESVLPNYLTNINQGQPNYGGRPGQAQSMASGQGQQVMNTMIGIFQNMQNMQQGTRRDR